MDVVFIAASGALVGVQVLNHLVIGGECVSMASRGLF